MPKTARPKAKRIETIGCGINFNKTHESRIVALIKGNDVWRNLLFPIDSTTQRKKWTAVRDVLLALFPHGDENERYMLSAKRAGLVVVRNGKWMPTQAWTSAFRDALSPRLKTMKAHYEAACKDHRIEKSWRSFRDMPPKFAKILREDLPWFFQYRGLLQPSKATRAALRQALDEPGPSRPTSHVAAVLPVSKPIRARPNARLPTPASTIASSSSSGASESDENSGSVSDTESEVSASDSSDDDDSALNDGGRASATGVRSEVTSVVDSSPDTPRASQRRPGSWPRQLAEERPTPIVRKRPTAPSSSPSISHTENESSPDEDASVGLSRGRRSLLDRTAAATRASASLSQPNKRPRNNSPHVKAKIPGQASLTSTAHHEGSSRGPQTRSSARAMAPVDYGDHDAVLVDSWKPDRTHAKRLATEEDIYCSEDALSAPAAIHVPVEEDETKDVDVDTDSSETSSSPSNAARWRDIRHNRDRQGAKTPKWALPLWSLSLQEVVDIARNPDRAMEWLKRSTTIPFNRANHKNKRTLDYHRQLIYEHVFGRLFSPPRDPNYLHDPLRILTGTDVWLCTRKTSYIKRWNKTRIMIERTGGRLHFGTDQTISIDPARHRIQVCTPLRRATPTSGFTRMTDLDFYEWFWKRYHANTT